MRSRRSPHAASVRLPFLGLGLSSNMNAAARPRPYELLASDPGLFDYIEYSAPILIERARNEASLFTQMEKSLATTPALFHPVHLNLYGPELEPFGALAALDAHARAVRSPWVSNDVAWWHRRGCAFPGYLHIAPPFDEMHARDVAVHALHAQAALETPLLLENPNILAVRGDLHVLEFMSAVREKTGLGLLLDLGHLWSHQLSAALPLTAGLEDFDFDAVIELHVAGGTVAHHRGRQFYIDDHPRPVAEEVLKLLELILPRCRNLCAVTFEGDGHSDPSAHEMLKRLRPMIESARKIDIPAPSPKLANRELELEPGAAHRAWELYEECYQGAEGRDWVGTHFEREFRLKVLSEKLDRRTPRLRSLFAAELDEFLSAECFFSGTDTFEAFARWARKKLVARPDDEAARVWVEEVMGDFRARR